MRRKVALITCLACLVALLAAPAGAAAFSVGLKAPTHHPKAGKKWPITVSAHRNGGKPVHASAFYQFVVGGNVVQSCTPLPGHPHATKCNVGSKAKTHRFFGQYRDVIIWPKRAISYHITFRVVVHMRHGGTKHVDYPVTVHG